MLAGRRVVPRAVPLERVALGLRGVERGHAAVHRAVAGLAVVLLVARPGEAHDGRRPPEGAVGVLEADGDVARGSGLALRQGDAQDGVAGLPAEERAELDPPRGSLLPAGEVVEGLDDGALPRLDHEHGLARGDGERLAHLARHEVGDLHRGLDELEVPAAGVGHPPEERLVEVGAHPERARGHPPAAPLRAPPLDLAVVRDAGVREAVGQEEAPSHRLGRQVLDDLLEPRRQPPSRSVWPRGAMRATARDAASRASAVACVVGTTTWMWSS